MTSFWYGVNRIRSEPAASARSATFDRMVPGHPARDRRDADGVEPVLELLHADVVDRVLDRLGRGAVDQRALEVFVSRTSRNFSMPQSLIRNFSRALARSRR